MKERTREFYNEAVRRAAVRVADRLDHALDLTELSRAAGLSPLHFHRIFRQIAQVKHLWPCTADYGLSALRGAGLV